MLYPLRAERHTYPAVVPTSAPVRGSRNIIGEGLKRTLVGRPMRSSQLSDTLLPKKLAMPVFCSDPLSSVAYATEEILLILSLGGLAFFHLAWYVSGAIVVLLAVVVASYRQTCRAYPNGGGAYTVASANLGQSAGLAAASALLVDYVLTVAVSVVAGVAAITSAFPALVLARRRLVRRVRGVTDLGQPARDARSQARRSPPRPTAS